MCRRCVDDSTRRLRQLCPYQKEAIGHYDDCMVRYSNRSIFGIMETTPRGFLVNVGRALHVVQFNQALISLLQKLQGEAATSGGSTRKFATGGRVLSPSCYFWYEIRAFYNETQADAPPPASPPALHAEFILFNHHVHDTEQAWRVWKEGEGQLLIDQNLVESCPLTEALRWINIALLCVQENPTDRPTMSSVVFMLGGQLTSLPQPSEPPFSVGRLDTPEQSSVTGEGTGFSPSDHDSTSASLFEDIERRPAASCMAKQPKGGSVRKFATGNAPGSDNATIYALVQCSPDISGQRCYECCRNGTGGYCNGRLGASYQNPSCNRGCGISPFYNETPTDAPHNSHLLQVNPVHSPCGILSFHAWRPTEKPTPTFRPSIPYTGNYTRDGAYSSNLDDVIYSLSTNTTSFSSVSAGSDPDSVNGIALCRGDINQDVCRRCVDDSTRTLCGARYQNPSCNIGYALTQFYNVSPAAAPPSAAPQALPPPANEVSLSKLEAPTSTLSFEASKLQGDDGDTGEIHYFNFSTIQAATNNFSVENKLGEGGFGPVYKAWRLLEEGKGRQLIDENLGYNCAVSEALRWINNALLCVQEDPQERPTMSWIVFMLGGQLTSLPQPSEPPFSVGRLSIYNIPSISEEDFLPSDKTSTTTSSLFKE
ncbi:hypothetical protein RJ639_042769 [Escallonia herrerae]|uniref:Gnk2-homologous domain-containing protein n=1 Tax=Escallonia herrerae TaxID=1293975 RepID=A0AA89B4V1_9ASTE|nr:hypothetical protein RJ639_042769 [Escallonia herrerae]